LFASTKCKISSHSSHVRLRHSWDLHHASDLAVHRRPVVAPAVALHLATAAAIGASAWITRGSCGVRGGKGTGARAGGQKGRGGTWQWMVAFVSSHTSHLFPFIAATCRRKEPHPSGQGSPHFSAAVAASAAQRHHLQQRGGAPRECARCRTHRAPTPPRGLSRSLCPRSPFLCNSPPRTRSRLWCPPPFPPETLCCSPFRAGVPPAEG